MALATTIKNMTREELEFIVYNYMMLQSDEDKWLAESILTEQIKIAKRCLKNPNYVINHYMKIQYEKN